MTSAAEIARIENLDLHDLRKEWERRLGAAPKFRSALLLRRMLAWRLQTAVEGDLAPATCKRLLGKRVSSGPGLRPGTILVREYLGVRHEVEVAENGFIHAGRRWKSLSQIARAITGVRWNGPRFFGLRDKPGQ